MRPVLLLALALAHTSAFVSLPRTGARLAVTASRAPPVEAQYWEAQKKRAPVNRKRVVAATKRPTPARVVTKTAPKRVAPKPAVKRPAPKP